VSQPRPSTDSDPLDWPVRGLSERSRRVAFAAAQAILCDHDGRGALVPAGDALCRRAVAAFDLTVGRASPEVRRAFGALTLFLDLLPLFVVGSFARMSRLPLARRLAYFEALEQSSVGLLSMLFVAFKVPLCMPAFEEPPELHETGFDRPTTIARRLRARAE
jgi:hypothetical protein